MLRKFCNILSVREQENPQYRFGPFVREGMERHLKTNTVKLHSAKAQVLDRLISLTVGTEMPINDDKFQEPSSRILEASFM